MKKKEQGVLTIEASIVLIIFLMFVLFLFSFVRIYRAQSVVSHAVLQSADALALESYLRELAHREDAEKIVELGNEITGVTSFNADNFTSLRAADIPKLAKEKFIAAIAGSKSNADAILKQLGIKDGLSGLDFSKSKMDLANNDVIIHVTYTLKMQFSVFGKDEITVTKAGKAKTFGNVLFEIVTIPNDNRKGTTNGGGSYKHGEVIEIVATPNYGYYFDGWDDNGDGIVDYDVADLLTTSSRTITVTDANTYTAIFKNKGYAVNAKVSPEEVETISGAGIYNYGSSVVLTVSNDNPHYNFLGWSGELRQDLDGNGVDEKITSAAGSEDGMTYTIPEVQGVYFITANFTPKQYRVTVEAQEGGDAYIKGTTTKSKIFTYKDEVSFEAFPAYGYAVDYWMRDGEKLEGTVGQTKLNNISIKSDVKYTVVFKSILAKVTFIGVNDNVIEELTLLKGQSFSSARLNMPKPTTSDGLVFEGWYTKKNGAGTKYTNSTIVNDHLTLYAYCKTCTHKYVWQFTTPATCIQRQTTQYKCEWCGTIKNEYGNYGSHKWGRCDVPHPIKKYTFRCETAGWNNQTNYWNTCKTTTYYHSVCVICKTPSGRYWCGTHGKGAQEVPGSCPW